MGFNSVTFDVSQTRGTPISIATANKPADVSTFFAALKKGLGTKATIMLTMAPTVEDGPAGPLAFLFKDFKSTFAGINIATYSTGTYYLDADDGRWGIMQWAAFVPIDKIHVGFSEVVRYSGKMSSQGKKYDIPAGTSNGQAAAYIWATMKKDLVALNKDYAKIGTPYFDI